MNTGIYISLFIGLTLSACASTGLSEPFSSSSPEAIVLGGAKYSYWNLERVDLDTQVATGEYVLLAGPSWVDTPRLKGENSELVFGIKKLKPGFYALESGSVSGWNGVATVSTTSCFDESAPVFKIEAGKLNVLPMHPDATKAQSSSQVQEVQKILQSHPDITSSVEIPEQVAVVDYGRRTRKERCSYDKNEKPLTILNKMN